MSRAPTSHSTLPSGWRFERRAAVTSNPQTRRWRGKRQRRQKSGERGRGPSGWTAPAATCSSTLTMRRRRRRSAGRAGRLDPRRAKRSESTCLLHSVLQSTAVWRGGWTFEGQTDVTLSHGGSVCLPHGVWHSAQRLPAASAGAAFFLRLDCCSFAGLGDVLVAVMILQRCKLDGYCAVLLRELS